jgi:hypothetical protein
MTQMIFRRYALCAAFLAFVLAGATVAQDQSDPSGCGDAVTRFLGMPNQQNLERLSRTDAESCWKMVASSNVKQKQLNEKVEGGNRWAARYLAAHLRELDGGNLEDSLIALGEFSERNMEYILLLNKQGLLSNHELSDSLTMLPLSTSDEPRAQLRTLKQRKNKVLQVHRADLSRQRTQALNSIDTFASEIRSKNRGPID